ncbi:MAG: prolipoprotein diacylglyceryl transferase, partial [Flavihumibacter sp.]|nr:prolipoprotein diacylglyceryl transferase [Flavihumibacter sp.]
ELVKKIIGEKQASGDLFVYPMLLALFIGRIGCFSMGVYEETYGIETTAITGMNLGDGLKRHPVALYEMVFLCLLCFCLIVLDKKIKLENGARFKLFMIAYILFRLFLDFIKPHYTLSVGLSVIQVACILGLLWYAPYIIKPKKLLLPINQKLKPVQKIN